MNESDDGESIERLKFLLSEMETELVMKSWDLSVTVAIGSAEIKDRFMESEGDSCIIQDYAA